MNKEYELRVYETEQDRDNGEFVLIPFSSCVGLKEAIEESYDYFNNNECVELLESDTEEIILNFSWEYNEDGNKFKDYEFYTEESKEYLIKKHWKYNKTKEEIFEILLHNMEVKKHDEELRDNSSKEDWDYDVIDNIRDIERNNRLLLDILTEDERVEFIYYTEESKELLHLLNEDKDKELQEPINLYSSDCKVRY